jgi:SAM-dependent methyltransferase
MLGTLLWVSLFKHTLFICKMSSTPDSIESCLICGGKRLKPLPRYTAHHLVRCRKCSFVFSSRRPSREELKKIYSAYQRGNSAPTHITLSKYNKTVSWLSRLRNIDAVLDVGCGDGHFLATFLQHGIKTYGTEYDSSMAQVAAGKGITMLSGGLQPKLPDSVNRFDLIVFTEVI